MNSRIASSSRNTSETQISCTVDLDGTGQSVVSTDLGFLDHMLNSLSRHSGFDISIECKGDLIVDDHHSIEDCAIVLGSSIDKALRDRRGITRFASAYAPLDESLARVAIDLSGRPSAFVEIDFSRDMIGQVATENLSHFFETLAVSMRATLHIDLIRGKNDHHKAEAAFKALAIALRESTRVQDTDLIPSTKGILS